MATVTNDGAAGYGLGARLGHSGEVHQAHSQRFQGPLAMKLYRRAAGLGPVVVAAFAEDAARASGLRHPHIVQVIEAGALRDGTPFLTTELLTGQTLEDHLVGRGAFLPTELLPLIRGTASALASAHAAGLVHRELRPDNIFIAQVAGYESGFVKILDFGVCHLTAAQWAAGRDLGLRATRYFAPEQLDSGRLDQIDHRADQFALAAIAYRVLSGVDAPVITGSATAATASMNAGAGATPPLARRAPAVDAVVSKAMSRLPADRFESVALFLRAFEEALAGAAMIATPAPVATIGGTPVATTIGGTPVATTIGGTPVATTGGTTLVAGSPSANRPRESFHGPVPPRRPEADLFSTAAQLDPTLVASPVDRRAHASASPTLAAKQATQRADGHRRPWQPDPASLTQRFFQEGDHHEETRYKNARLDHDDFSESGLDFASFDRVPRRRTPLVAALLVLVVGGAALAWWAGLRPPAAWTQSEWWQALHLPTGRPENSTPPSATILQTDPQPEPAAVGAVLPTGAVLPAPAPTADTTAASAPSAVAPPADAAVPPPPPSAAAVGAPSEPAEASGSAEAAGSAGSAEAAEPAAAPAPKKASTGPSGKEGRRSSSRIPLRRPSSALRGYIWSPEKQQMVPSGNGSAASEPWPPGGGESPPAPPPLPASELRPGPPPFQP